MQLHSVKNETRDILQRIFKMTNDLPSVSVQDVLNCSFPNWYPLFGKHSLKRYILKIFFF